LPPLSFTLSLREIASKTHSNRFNSLATCTSTRSHNDDAQLAQKMPRFGDPRGSYKCERTISSPASDVAPTRASAKPCCPNIGSTKPAATIMGWLPHMCRTANLRICLAVLLPIACNHAGSHIDLARLVSWAAPEAQPAPLSLRNTELPIREGEGDCLNRPRVVAGSNVVSERVSEVPHSTPFHVSWSVSWSESDSREQGRPSVNAERRPSVDDAGAAGMRYGMKTDESNDDLSSAVRPRLLRRPGSLSGFYYPHRCAHL